MQHRAPYNYDPDAASLAAGLDCSNLPSLTQQQFAEEVDINTIVQRFGLTGQLPNGIAMPQTGDFTDAPDFHTAMNLLRQAQDSFMELPANIRARFDNDPGKVIRFLEDPNNRDEAIRLGIVAKPPETDRTGTPVDTPTQPPDNPAAQ